MSDDKRFSLSDDSGFELMPSFEEDPNFSVSGDAVSSEPASVASDFNTDSSPAEDMFSFSDNWEIAATKRVDVNMLPEDEQLRVSRRDPSGQKSKRARKKRFPKWAKSLIWVGLMALVIILLSTTIITVAQDVYGLGKGTPGDPREIEIYVDKGDTLYDVIEALGEEDIIKSSLICKAYIKLKKPDTTIQYGLHVFKDTMGYEDIFAELRTQTEFKDVVNITIKEGLSIDEIALKLQEKGVCDASEFIYAIRNEEYESDLFASAPINQKIYYRLEGYIYPDTYQFYSNSTGKMVVQKMLDRMEEMFTLEMRQAAANMGWSWHDVLTLASIVEEEANGLSDAEKQKVAAVFINRLNWTTEPKFLGSDPTVVYSKTHGDATMFYNTYANGYEGLPPGPICSPTQSSIKAVLEYNRNFDYYYFYSSEGKIYYSKTYKEHQAIIKKYS
ncbi:MAG: endolytic transglycosylase MltG [Clostridia bacterium]|nr:endolytic transglycosylase MltG [Clostridia bacterium]